jgi:hypothetical protein
MAGGTSWSPNTSASEEAAMRKAPRARPSSHWIATQRLIALVMVIQQLAPPSALAGTLYKTGRWYGAGDIGVQGTHVTLLREPQTNFAKVFLLGESGSGQKLKVWRFSAASNAARLPSISSTDSSSLLYFIPHPNDRKVDLFCGGHSTLADGRMLLIGGAWSPVRPCQEAYAFDPR